MTEQIEWEIKLSTIGNDIIWIACYIQTGPDTNEKKQIEYMRFKTLKEAHRFIMYYNQMELLKQGSL